MEVKLIGAIDYNKLRKVIAEKVTDEKEQEELLSAIKELEIGRRSEIVASAGRLSRAAGTILDILGISEGKTLEQNKKFIDLVIGMGHNSITDHDYCVFAIKDVSPIVEQTIIEERFSSFTIKSRREVDFSDVGFYIPTFHDENGNVLENNEELQKEYVEHMQMLFETYTKLKDGGIPQEDARFILPYSYYSNILMGIDAHTLKDLIVKLTKTKYANIDELRELGEKLYDIAAENMPYLIPEIDKIEPTSKDAAEEYLNSLHKKEPHKLTVETKLLASPKESVDDTILISALMRRYQYDRRKAKKVYKELCDKNPDFKEDLMKVIAFASDGLELTQVNFEFQTVLSLAILTHLTRHRTHHIITPDFVPNLDITKYITPPKVKQNKELNACYDNVYATNKKVYDHFKAAGVREEDLIYFALSGTYVTALTNMDGRTLAHILRLRECTKAQWETRNMATAMHEEIKKVKSATAFEKILGPTCVTQGICNEGKESCGRVKVLQKK